MRALRAGLAVLIAAGLAMPGAPRPAAAQIQPIPILPAQPAGTTSSAADTISPVAIGDVVSIGVQPVDEYSREVTIHQDGKVDLPIVGSILLKGLTPREIQLLLESKYSRFVTGVKISVSVRRFAGRRVALLGEFRTPGSYDYRDGMKMLDAVTLGGGLTDLAKGSKARIIRVKDGKIETVRVNVKALIKGRSDMNVDILPGDTVLVPKGALTRGAQWFGVNIVPYLTLVTLLASVAVLTNTR